MTVKRKDFDVCFEYPDEEELIEIIHRAEIIVQNQRQGFTIDIHGSCCKGPQGINWFVVVDFSDNGGSMYMDNAIKFAKMYGVE